MSGGAQPLARGATKALHQLWVPAEPLPSSSCCQVLVELGADMHAIAANHQTAVQLATGQGFAHVARVLKTMSAPKKKKPPPGPVALKPDTAEVLAPLVDHRMHRTVSDTNSKC